MKVKVVTAPPEAWYAYLLDKEVDIEFVSDEMLEQHRSTNIFLQVVPKTWDWYWRRDQQPRTIPFDDCELIDKSGSVAQDFYDLGVAHGKVLEEQRLIKEGILEADEEDEAVTLHL